MAGTLLRPALRLHRAPTGGLCEDRQCLRGRGNQGRGEGGCPGGTRDGTCHRRAVRPGFQDRARGECLPHGPGRCRDQRDDRGAPGMKSHTLSVLVENRAGVLSRVAGMFSRRGFNIESLAVGTCEEPDMSRITIVVKGDGSVVEQVMKQTNKLIDVIKVSDLTERESVERELALIKVAAEPGTSRAEILQIADIFRAQVVDVGAKTLVLQ